MSKSQIHISIAIAALLLGAAFLFGNTYVKAAIITLIFWYVLEINRNVNGL